DDEDARAEPRRRVVQSDLQRAAQPVLPESVLDVHMSDDGHAGEPAADPSEDVARQVRVGVEETGSLAPQEARVAQCLVDAEAAPERDDPALECRRGGALPDRRAA